MYNITLIFSMHIQIGKCNSEELYCIIKNENPEIIFEEFDVLRNEDEYYKNGHYKSQKESTLETIAIMKYIENHKVKYVPVDTYEITNFPRNMYKKISLANGDYDKLFKENIILSGQNGFQYINSIDCNNLIEKLHMIEEEVLENTIDNKLIEDYNSWKIITNNRDIEMIKNIYKYSKKYNYNNAVFITGAEHRKSILEKINEFNSKEEIKINWRSWRIA
jgi:hypothetical protein